MAAGATYTPIATTTLGSAAWSVTFSSVPQTYTDLVLVVTGTAANGSDCSLKFNSDSGTNYSWTRLSGNGTSAVSLRGSNDSSGTIGALFSGNQGNIIMNIQNYSNSTTYKTTLSRANNAGVYTGTYVSLWRNTSAITNIVFNSNNELMDIGCTFTLYGITAA